MFTQIRNLQTLFIAFAILCSISIEIFAATKIENTVFVILRHVRNENDSKLWQRCYNSIREFYPENVIVIIDDNSKIKSSDDLLNNTIVINSEYPGAGELLPYYYFLKYKWAEKMIFLHDSMLLKREFSESELDHPIKFHWHFDQHQYDDNRAINAFLQNLTNGRELINYNKEKSLWNGCFGVTSIIDLNLLESIEEKYSFTSSLIEKIKCRNDRMALERIFAILIFKEGYVTRENCSNFGSIFDFPMYWYQVDDAFIDQLKITYPGAILKTWHGR